MPKQVASAPQEEKTKHGKTDVNEFLQFLEDTEKEVDIFMAGMGKTEEDSKTKKQKDAKQVASAHQEEKTKHGKTDFKKFDQFLEDTKKDVDIIMANMKKAEEDILKKQSQNPVQTAQEQQDCDDI